MIAQNRPVARRQWIVLALVLGTMVIDGLDTQLLALVSPRIMSEWGVDKARFGPAMSAALFGMALGAGGGGWLGDRVGRKLVLVGATLLFGLCTMAVAVTESLPLLIVLRFLSGLGFGAVNPNGAAMVSEWLPLRLRARIVALLSISIPGGGLLGGSAVLALLPSMGWRGCFALCGVATLAVAALLARLVPESPAYLATRGRTEEAERLVLHVTGTPAVRDPAAPAAVLPRQRVLTRANLRLNLGTWLAFFSFQLIAYGFISWTPVLLTTRGWPLATAIQGTLVFNLSAIAGSLLTAWLIERLRFRNLALALFLGAFAALILLQMLLASPVQRPLATFAAIGLVSVLVGIGIAGVYAFVAFAYPPSCRANGIGATLMSGRIGGIVIAFSGGLLLAMGDGGAVPFFATLLGTALLGALGAVLLGRRYAVVLGQDDGLAHGDAPPGETNFVSTAIPSPISAAGR